MQRNKVVHGSGTLILENEAVPVRYKMCLSITGTGDVKGSVVLEKVDEALESAIFGLPDSRARLALADGQEIGILLSSDGWTFLVEGEFPDF